MAKYRHALPQTNGTFCLTDGGLETTLVFIDGRDLPEFAAFPLLQSDEGRTRLRTYIEPYIAAAKASGAGFVLESPTWRAHPDCAATLGVSLADLDAVNHRAITDLMAVRDDHETEAMPMVVSGQIGPRRDGYAADLAMTADEAEVYHGRQVRVFADAGADMVAALTMTNVPEAIGIVRAAKTAEIPAAISFTVETDGRLPSGDTLADAIATVDSVTDGGPAYYMVNCAHPTHFAEPFGVGGAWLQRIKGLRANASCMSHEELDNSTELDRGNPAELGRQLAEMRMRHPQITVLGGCCGTDHDHIHHIADNLKTAAAA